MDYTRCEYKRYDTPCRTNPSGLTLCVILDTNIRELHTRVWLSMRREAVPPNRSDTCFQGTDDVVLPKALAARLPMAFISGTFSQIRRHHPSTFPFLAQSQQTEAPELPSPLPPPQPSPRLLDGMPDNVISGTPPTEPSRSPTPAVESTQRPEPEAQTKESAGAALGAVCGTCMVCLEDCDDVLGPAWLHPYRSMPVSSPAGGEERKEGEIHVGSDDCAVSACLACLKTYFTVSETGPAVLCDVNLLGKLQKKLGSE